MIDLVGRETRDNIVAVGQQLPGEAHGEGG